MVPDEAAAAQGLRQCICPDHPGCARQVLANRRYCSTCRNFCGPFRHRAELG
jgi:hypothetical protein